MGNVLRSVHRCVVSHKFYDGLPAASDCAQSIEMYCHTWKYLRGKYFWSGSGLYLHASPGKEYTDSLSFVSFICECSYDLDRVENPNTQRISKGICGIICQCISAWGSIYMAAAVCARGKSFFWRSSRKLLSGDWNLEISFVSAAHEQVSIYSYSVYFRGELHDTCAFRYREQPVRSGYGEAGLHFRKETGRGNSKRKGTSDTALYPVLFSWNRERGTSGNQSRKNVHSYRAGVLGGKAAHWNL